MKNKNLKHFAGENFCNVQKVYWRNLYRARFIAVPDIIVWAILNCENKWQAWWKGEYSEICLGGGGLKFFQGALSTRWNHKFYWSKGGRGLCPHSHSPRRKPMMVNAANKHTFWFNYYWMLRDFIIRSFLSVLEKFSHRPSSCWSWWCWLTGPLQAKQTQRKQERQFCK